MTTEPDEKQPAGKKTSRQWIFWVFGLAVGIVAYKLISGALSSP